MMPDITTILLIVIVIALLGVEGIAEWLINVALFVGMAAGLFYVVNWFMT